MLLSRSAENLYWHARYLERSDDTARIVREHTNLIVDLPTIVPLTWAPLLAIAGVEAAPGGVDETSVIKYLVADRSNPSSVASSTAAARENLRSTRELVPSELWNAINDLYLYVSGNRVEGIARVSRRRYLDRVIAECQRVEGIVSGTMSRNTEYAFVRLGTLIERADMTTRVVDVSAATIGSQGERALHADVQWSSVLRSVAGLQMFRRTSSESATGAASIRFLFGNASFPRSFAYCLTECATLLPQLPDGGELGARCLDLAADALNLPDSAAFSVDAVRSLVDRLQQGIAAIHSELARRYFGHGRSA